MKEYRCPKCNRLLVKAVATTLQKNCRHCKLIHTWLENGEIISTSK